MLECGNQLRVTRTEVEELAEIHLDLSAVKSRADLSKTLVPWLLALLEKRPDLVARIVREVLASRASGLD